MARVLSTTVTDGNHILRCNFHASINWWNWCSANDVPLIYASSAATYGNGEIGFIDNEDLGYLDSLRPLNLYGWSKHQFDKWAVENANRGYKPPQWAGLKFFNVFHSNEYHKGSMMSLVAKNTQKIACWVKKCSYFAHIIQTIKMANSCVILSM